VEVATKKPQKGTRSTKKSAEQVMKKKSSYVLFVPFCG
jgi:hypothetical protein